MFTNPACSCTRLQQGRGQSRLRRQGDSHDPGEEQRRGSGLPHLGRARSRTYPIGNQKKGIYYLTYFSSEGKNLVTIEHDCALNEMIMRQLVIKIPLKLVETMLSLAKGEHAVALHNMQEEPGTEDAIAGVDAGGDNGRRRGREPRD